MVEAKDGSLKRLPRAEYNMADTRWRERRCWPARKPPRTPSSRGRSRGSSSQNWRAGHGPGCRHGTIEPGATRSYPQRLENKRH